MKPYSLDLRERIAAAVDNHEGSRRQLAERFGVDVSTITRLLQRRRATGSLQPAPHGGGVPPALDEAALARLRELVGEQPDATLEELHDRLGVPCSIMTIARALLRHRITRKKKTLRALERDRPDVQKSRKAFTQKVAKLDPESLVFVDETGATTAMTRAYGRAEAGERVEDSVPGKWETVTLIAALRLSGVVAPLVFPGATDNLAFETYVEQVLVPQLAPGDVVIWDNLKPHKQAKVIAAVKEAQAKVEALPPYSPDKTPIEKLFSKLKAALRSAKARTIEAIYQAIGDALAAVSLDDIKGWFQECGLCATPL